MAASAPASSTVIPADLPKSSGGDPESGPLLDPVFLHKLEQLELVSRKIFVGRMKGERKSRRRGSSVEFAEHRNYTAGDDLRHIDWNVYGRLDKLFLKLFLEEEDLHVYTLLDTSLSMDFGTPTKLRYGKQVAAALSFIGLVNHDRVLVDTFSARVVQVLSQEEVEPELVGDLRLVDAEDDEIAEITISLPLLKRYRDNLNAFVAALKEWCTSRGITYIFTTNQYPFDKLILNYLRERGLVK